MHRRTQHTVCNVYTSDRIEVFKQSKIPNRMHVQNENHLLNLSMHSQHVEPIKLLFFRSFYAWCMLKMKKPSFRISFFRAYFKNFLFLSSTHASANIHFKNICRNVVETGWFIRFGMCFALFYVCGAFKNVCIQMNLKQ